MSEQTQYVYRVRNKQTGEFLRNGAVSIWIRKHNAERNFPHSIKVGDAEVVMFELREVKEF